MLRDHGWLLGSARLAELLGLLAPLALAELVEADENLGLGSADLQPFHSLKINNGQISHQTQGKQGVVPHSHEDTTVQTRQGPQQITS